jgi:hypothetical protein
MRIERAQRIAVVLALLATSGVVHAQSAGAPAPPPAAKPTEKKPPAPAPTPAPAPPPAAKPPAAPKPAPPPPKAKPPAPPPKPPAHPEDEAIIEQLELFMLMEMMKDYDILRETDR